MFQDTVKGDTFLREAPIVISAMGTLDRFNIPDIEGAAMYHDNIFYSARWDDSVNMKNKNVIIIGNINILGSGVYI
jgi:cation diffusion facilitator CzcD-associated flavoprotein CzcO